MTLLVISPDYASHLLPLVTLATAWRDRGERVVVATGPATAGIVEEFGLERVDLRLGRGSNPGVIAADQQPVDEGESLRGFFDATREGAVPTLAYQAAERLTGRPFIEGAGMTAGEWMAASHPRDDAGELIAFENLPLGITMLKREPAHGVVTFTSQDGAPLRIENATFPLFAHTEDYVGTFAIVWPLERPMRIADETRERFYIEPFGFDSTLAPSGKSPLKVVFRTSYRYWHALAQDPQRYADEKQRIAETVIGLLEPRFPGIGAQVEVADVATPVTTERFTGNAGGYEYPASRMVMALLTGRRLSQTLKGLGDFYMVGQYAGPPGVPMVATMGRDVVRALCRQDGRPFVAEPAAEARGRERAA